MNLNRVHADALLEMFVTARPLPLSSSAPFFVSFVDKIPQRALVQGEGA